MNKPVRDSAGFTVVEMLVVVLMTGFFVTLLLYFTFSYWRYSYLLEADQDTLTTRLNAGDIIRESLGTSSGLILQNGIPDDHPNNPDPTDATGKYWLTIHAVPGNKSAATGTTTPVMYYRRFSFDASNAVIMNGAQPYEDEDVMYLDGTKNQLRLRSLANTSAIGNRLKTSCPAAYVTTSCPADRVIADNVASVDMRYFSRTGNLIDWTSIYDSSISTYIGPDFTTVDVVEIKLNLTKKPVFQQTKATVNNTVIRVALRNT